MAYSGIIVLAFLIFHILHFTLGDVQSQYFHTFDDKHRWDAYAMFVHGFRQPGIYAIYFVGIALLAAHLGHGAASWMQSLGLRHPKYPTDKLGPLVAIGLFVGYMVPPTAVLVGAIS
jgi:succinate dehydrogenase / fumarate reductase cytochrome b subunit